jgi:hypothetical protein
MLKTVTLQTLPRRNRLRNELVSKKESIKREESPAAPPPNLPTVCCQSEEAFLDGGFGTDQDGDILGQIDSVGDYISSHNLGNGNPVYTLAQRINPSTYDLPSAAKYIISVAIDTIPTTKFTFTAPETIRFPATLHEESKVYVRYII